MEDRTSLTFAGVLACAVLLLVAALIYGAAAAPYLDDDVCLTSREESLVREGSRGSQRWSWLPVGVECTWRRDGQTVEHFAGPPRAVGWIALGFASGGGVLAILGVVAGIRDLRRQVPV